MKAFPEGFPKEDSLVKKHINFSCTTSKIHLYIIGVPISAFITSQLFICLPLPLPEGPLFSSMVEFVRRNTWGLTTDVDCRRALRLTSVWAMVNIGLYTAMSIIGAFVMLDMEKLRGNTSWLGGKALNALLAVKDGPAHSYGWIRNAYFQRYFISKSSETSFFSRLLPIVADVKTVMMASLMCKLIKAYIDRHTGGVSSILTLKIRLLKIACLPFWGMYPFVRALEQNIDTFVEAIGKEVPGVFSYNERHKWNFLGLLLRDRGNAER